MVRVLLAAEVLFYRQGLTGVLAHDVDLDVVGVAGSVAEVMAQAQELDPDPDVVLLDVALEGALATVSEVRAAFPQTKVVALAISDAATDLVSWARAGIAAFVSRDASIDTLVATIKATTQGESMCSPRITAQLLKGLVDAPPEVAPDVLDGARLTGREREIVGLLDLGRSNKEIAQALSIAVPTVKNHVHNILEKLRVARRSDAASALLYRSAPEPTPAPAPS